MTNYPLTKKPAFFPSPMGEIFFEADASTAGGQEILFDTALDAELDAILNSSEDATA
ncbi:MAG: hypothetical protein H5T76_22635 [Streptomyces sp.]|uniref:hypothetical protein n=1 Tax=Streptomyces sp. B93 TaxID=2824875 RepID=UPI0019CAB7B5|nr:hypothetical protein [Streptomyces sp. B93]MBC7271468.1 hypothetical protein [Streptomyces sp.]MBQ1089382.1 hypothetical protein [Streptomyces sp. B93]